MAKVATGALRGANPKVGDSPYGQRPSKPQGKPNDLSKTLLLIDPEKITTWQHKDRKPQELEDDPTFHELIRDFQSGGMNVQPVLIRPYRPVKGQKALPGVEYEEIFGYKRHQAAKRAGKPVLCIFEDLSDEEAHSRMIKENRSRSGLSPWTKALSWNNALTNGLSTKAKLAAEEGIDESTIDQYLRILEIVPNEIVEGVDVHKLGAEALFEIRSALLEFGDGPNREKFIHLVIKNAPVIADRKGYKKLIEKIRAEARGSENSQSRIEPRTLNSGRSKLVTMKPGKTGYSVTIHSKAAKALDLDEFEKTIAAVLKERGIKIS